VSQEEAFRNLRLSERNLDQDFENLNGDVEDLVSATNATMKLVGDIFAIQRNIEVGEVSDEKNARQQEREAASELSDMIETAFNDLDKVINIANRISQDAKEIKNDLNKDQKSLQNFITESDSKDLS